MTGNKVSFGKVFYPSFKASKEFAEKYDKECLRDYHRMKSVSGMTIIHSRVEDNELNSLLGYGFLALLDDFFDVESVRHDSVNIGNFK